MRGRFAPSPTGPLHFGSLVAAVGSYLDARAHGAEWLVRIEDVDVPRTVPGAADQILRTLEAFHLHWDGAVVYQSQRTEMYRAAFARLLDQGDVFPCSCTRRELEGQRYPGTCRQGTSGPARAWRMRVPNEILTFQDRRLGSFAESLLQTCGDFPLLRADGWFAYQLAVVVDDADQGVASVVRGADLLDSTARQIYLQRRLGLPTPYYLHLPVAVDECGYKLSKQTHAAPVQPGLEVARAVLRFLGQPDPELPLRELWHHAASLWSYTLRVRADSSVG